MRGLQKRVGIAVTGLMFAATSALAQGSGDAGAQTFGTYEPNSGFKVASTDIPMAQVAVGTALTAVAIALYFRFVVLAGMPGATTKTLVALTLTLLISFLFAAVSAWAVAMISITPVSGMTLTTLIIAAVVLSRLGLAGEEGMLATLLIRKQGMQLASKMRFISAQFEAYLRNGLWLENARHAALLWIDTAREFGDPVPEPRGHRLVFA
jgi:hypothetical protein